MGLFDRNKKKDEIVEDVETQFASENNETTENSETIVEESETMSETKKKYMYLAVDENGSAVETQATDMPVDSKQDRVSQDNSKVNAEQTNENNDGTNMPQTKINDSEPKIETPSEKSKETVNGDIKEIMSEIKKVSEQIDQDIIDAFDDIEETIKKNVQDTVKNLEETIKKNVPDTVKKQVKNLEETIKKNVQDTVKNLEARTKGYIESSTDINSQKVQKTAEDISRKVNDAGRSIGESQDKIISKVNIVGKRMGDLVESVEGIEGNLTRLDQLDEIANLLRDKGLNISMEIPPVYAEEEDIINLVRYSQKITEQLGYAARDLIRKREAFKNQAESNENEQKVMAQRIEVARQEGITEGRIQVVKQLLSKYEDIDAIKDSTENYIHVIWTMLTELGVVIDGDGFYEKGKKIDLTDEDIEKMMATYSKFDGAGKYRVVKTGLSLHGEIISVAQFSKITEEEAKNGDSSSQNDERQSDSEVEETKADVNHEDREESKTAE